jgi:hypothetical protein
MADQRLAALAVCARCRVRYPTALLSPLTDILMTDTGEPAQAVCGICALALMNQRRGSNDTRLESQMAEDLRQQAIAWRREHPTREPLKVRR